MEIDRVRYRDRQKREKWARNKGVNDKERENSTCVPVEHYWGCRAGWTPPPSGSSSPRAISAGRGYPKCFIVAASVIETWP